MLDTQNKARNLVFTFHWPQDAAVNYHQIKDDYFLSQGIQILHIKEEDWIKDKESCMQKCLDFLGASDGL